MTGVTIAEREAPDASAAVAELVIMPFQGLKPPSTGHPPASIRPLPDCPTSQKTTEFQRFRPGVAYYGYRWLDPATSRWPSRDPIEEEGGVNVYAFVRNGSISVIDVLGNMPLASPYAADQWVGTRPPPPATTTGIPMNQELECDGDDQRETEEITADELDNFSLLNILDHKLEKLIFENESDARFSAITAVWKKPCGEDDEIVGMALTNVPSAGSTNSWNYTQTAYLTIESRNINFTEESVRTSSRAKFCCKCVTP